MVDKVRKLDKSFIVTDAAFEKYSTYATDLHSLPFQR